MLLFICVTLKHCWITHAVVYVIILIFILKIMLLIDAEKCNI